jgi:hypothetical protein
MDNTYQKLTYVRYADNWIIGIIGSKNFAETIREQIRVFLLKHLKLTLTSEKSHISHLGRECANFLGYQIKCGQAGDYSGRSITKDMFASSKRTVGWQPRFFVPMDNVIKRLSEKNFCTSIGFPLKKKGWIVYDDQTIISRYNSVIRGFHNYYAPADNLGTSMNRINYIMKYSCAHTLAAKHRTRISTQLRRRDVKSIKVLLDDPPVKVNPWDFRVDKVNEIDLEKAFTSFASRTQILSSDLCVICDSKSRLEMHNVKALRKGGVNLKDNYMLAMMQRINRKQICVCQKCHMKIHAGKYDGMSLKFLS